MTYRAAVVRAQNGISQVKVKDSLADPSIPPTGLDMYMLDKDRTSLNTAQALHHLSQPTLDLITCSPKILARLTEMPGIT